MIRVAFAIPALDKGGPDGVFHQLLCGLDRRRFTPTLIVQKTDGHYLRQLPADIDVAVIGERRDNGAGYPVKALRRLLMQQRPDVLLSTLRMTLTASAALFALPGKRPVHLLRPANHLSENTRVLMRAAPLKHALSFASTIAALRRCDGLICQSQSLATDLQRYAGRRPQRFVIGNPVDVAAVTALAAAADVTVPGSPSLISVGRLYPQKGYDLLIAALPMILRVHPDAHLTLVGEGPDRTALQAQAEQLGVGRHVSLPGFTTNPYPQVRAADLFISSSRYEGFPNAVLEALALGKPVVATDCPGGTAELVRPGVTGWLTPNGDVAALGRTILAALAAGPLPAASVIKACEQRFSGDTITRQYEAAILQTLSPGKAVDAWAAQPPKGSA